MSSAERETQIVEEAIRFFSEVGFSGKTRELSRRLGISQPLLYRYFSSKQALIDRVYDHVFLGRWDPAWVSLIQDASRGLRDRLIEFYRQYAVAVYRPDWVRIYILAGLADTGLNKRYLEFVSRELLNAICLELRRYCGEDERTFEGTPEEGDEELDSLVYVVTDIAIRNWSVPGDASAYVASHFRLVHSGGLLIYVRDGFPAGKGEPPSS